MCGILGIISKEKHKHIEKCNALQSHRGPDDNGIYINDNVAIGHNRLSIIEVSKLGHQPMLTKDKNIVIIFNGEIYNHKELRFKFLKDYRFNSNSDTETILIGYQYLGNKIFEKLNGIFSLAIYDIKKNKLIIARDHMGVKPLYYYFKNGEFFFASEIKTFLKIPGWDKSLDYNSLMSYQNFLYSPGKNTPFLNVKKFPPGHFLECDLESIDLSKIKKYYQVPFDGNYSKLKKNELIDELDSRMTNAVQRQLLSDVPVSFFLSGGLDSSLIVAKAKKILDYDIDCFTIASDSNKVRKEGFSDDLNYARKVAKHLGVKLHEVDGGIDILNDFDKMIWHLDEPQADIAPMHVMNICKVARKNGFKVILGGSGGDDLFSGYRRHLALKLEGIAQYLPKIATNSLHCIGNKLPTNHSSLRRIKKVLINLNQNQIDRMTGYFEWLPKNTNYDLFSPDIKKINHNYDPSHILINALKDIPNEKNLLNKMLYWEMKYFLTDHNLNYTDKLSMACGVEVRVPYLDLDLVNFSTKISPKLKLQRGTTKYILKKMAEKYLPKEVIYRKKSGFGGPVREWVKNDLNDMINDYLSPNKIKERGIFDHLKVQNLISQNKNGKIDASYNIWCLLSIESWLRQFYD